MLKIKFILWDQETDGIAVEHDGHQVWQETCTEFDQYLRHYMPRGWPTSGRATSTPTLLDLSQAIA